MSLSITKESPKYPFLLKKIKNPPEVLYYKGTLDNNIFTHCLGVVGSRKITTYGQQVIQEILPEIVNSGITIVSGLSKGIDATAHQITIDSCGKTVAVMPCGIDRIYPAKNRQLYNDILKNKGLIISEFTGHTKTARWTYPRRNRIVAGITDALLVIEAGEKSGSLITADFSKQFRRRIFTIPGSIFSKNSKGISQLLQDGAEIVTCAKDVIKFFNLSYPTKQNIISNKNPLHHNKQLEKIGDAGFKAYQMIREQPCKMNSLSKKINIHISKLSSIISILEVNDLIFKKGDIWNAY